MPPKEAHFISSYGCDASTRKRVVKDKFYNLIFRYFYFTGSQLAALALPLGSDSAKQIIGTTSPMDGGWTVQ